MSPTRLAVQLARDRVVAGRASQSAPAICFSPNWLCRRRLPTSARLFLFRSGWDLTHAFARDSSNRLKSPDKDSPPRSYSNPDKLQRLSMADLTTSSHIRPQSLPRALENSKWDRSRRRHKSYFREHEVRRDLVRAHRSTCSIWMTPSLIHCLVIRSPKWASD